MKRTETRKLQEISTLNFVELPGSEQAVAEDRFFMAEASVKQFITRSFNGLSQQLLRAALRKKTGLIEDGDC
jgi:hypothetical protein